MSPKCSSLIRLLSLVLCSLSLSCSAFTTQQYKEALQKSILFFEGQRSGRLPATQRMNWRADSALTDGSAANVDLAGGYYDAGDNLKFGLPMAFSTTLLSWGVIEFGSSMSDQLDHAKEAIRWGTDYLIKASTQTPNTLYVQVGEPNADHKCWERPEDMDTPRTVYSVTPDNPGSDVAGETAAALAAASIVFKTSDPSYSKTLLQTATQVFDFADNNRGSYDSGSIHQAVCPFYCSYSGYQDELFWSASWLYKASGDNNYLNYIETNGDTMGANQDDMSFSWDDKRAGNKILLYEVFLTASLSQTQMYKSHSDNYICSLIRESPTFQGQFTPGGLFYKDASSNMQYVTSMTMLLLTYAKHLTASGKDVECGGSTTFKPDKLVSLAKQQVDYIMGDNPAKMSYMVGFSQTFPLNIHHRGSSIPSVHAHNEKIGCQDGEQYFSSASPNPNQLTGAIVGGPDKSDNYKDERSDYQEGEPTTYINAGFVAAAAFFSASTD